MLFNMFFSSSPVLRPLTWFYTHRWTQIELRNLIHITFIVYHSLLAFRFHYRKQVGNRLHDNDDDDDDDDDKIISWLGLYGWWHRWVVGNAFSLPQPQVQIRHVHVQGKVRNGSRLCLIRLLPVGLSYKYTG